jgi:hypothetical protein
MKASPKKVFVGGAIIALAVDMLITPPAFVSLAVLLAGAFLLVLGLFPQDTIRTMNRIPYGHHLVRPLLAFDRWFEATAGAATYDPAVAQQLQHLFDRGCELRAKYIGVPDQSLFPADLRQWVDEVGRYLDAQLPQEAFLFRSIGQGVTRGQHSSLNWPNCDL